MLSNSSYSVNRSRGIQNRADKMDRPDISAAIVEELDYSGSGNCRIKLFIKREDRIHEAISGNKWRKLKYNLKKAGEEGYVRLLTFGGAYSNHIYAVAAAGKIYGFETVGVIRGEENASLNPTLSEARNQGMELFYLSRSDYSEKKSEKIMDSLRKRYGEFYMIPEGGSNPLALKGCVEMVTELDRTYDLICLPCGTGGTLAGILEGLQGRSFVLGFPVLKNGSFLRKDIDSLNRQYSGRTYDNYALLTGYHFGGYAKYTDELIQFINAFHEQYNIRLDPVYTGKMMSGIFDLIRSGRLRDMNILAIHTGGLQGIRGFNKRFGNLIR